MPSPRLHSLSLHGMWGDAIGNRVEVGCYSQVINSSVDEMDEPEYRVVTDEFQEVKMRADLLTFSKVAACKHLRR